MVKLLAGAVGSVASATRHPPARPSRTRHLDLQRVPALSLDVKNGQRVVGNSRHGRPLRCGLLRWLDTIALIAGRRRHDHRLIPGRRSAAGTVIG